MPDTGPPWNIPYVDDSDLVRDFPTADEAQALAIAAGLTTSNNIKQVVTAVKADTFSTASAGFVDVTNYEVSITPTSNTSKVLILVNLTMGYDGTGRAGFALFRDATNLIAADSPGSRTPAFTSPGPLGARSMYAFSFSILDSPATDLATVYKVSAFRSAGTIYVNRSELDGNDASHARGVSTITAIEVAA
jgi:hypothetical protein